MEVLFGWPCRRLVLAVWIFWDLTAAFLIGRKWAWEMLCPGQEGTCHSPGIHVGTQLELHKRVRRLVLMFSKLQEEVLQGCIRKPTGKLPCFRWENQMWGCRTWSRESQNCKGAEWVATHRKTRVRWGGSDRSWNLHLHLNEGLLFRRTELALPEIKRMIGCSASLKLRGQNIGCQIPEIRKEQNHTLSQAVSWGCNCSASDI